MRVQCANNTNVTLAPHNCERKIRHKQGWPNKHTSTAHSVLKIKDRRNNNTLSNHICSRFTPPVRFSFLKHRHCPNIDAGLNLFRIVSSYINWKKKPTLRPSSKESTYSRIFIFVWNWLSYLSIFFHLEKQKPINTGGNLNHLLVIENAKDSNVHCRRVYFRMLVVWAGYMYINIEISLIVKK